MTDLPSRLRVLPPAAEINEGRAYSLEEVAALISMSRDFVYDLCRDGRLRHAYLGRGKGVIRVRHVHLIQYLDSQEH